MNDKISTITQQLYDSTPDNVIGVGYGLKTKQGIETSARSIIFYVEKKKPLSELDPSEILPSSVNVDGESLLTDVQARTVPQLIGSCFNALDATSDENRQNRSSLQGGISISLDTLSTPYAGTLGAIVRDNEDGSLVALTNAHVALFAMDRGFINGDKDLINYPDLATWNAENKGFAQSGAIDGWGPTFGHVKRYAPLLGNPLGANTVDAALISIEDIARITTAVPNEFYTVLGYLDPGASSRTTQAPLLQIASSQELQTLFTSSGQIYINKSGRSTGYIGSSVFSNSPGCNIKLGSTNIALQVGFIDSNFQSSTLLFTNVVEILYDSYQTFNDPNTSIPYSFPRENVVVPGDSGSVVYTYINSVPKIIGLIFAAGSFGFPSTGVAPLDWNIGFFIPIDAVCNALNISAITDPTDTSLNPESNWIYITQSGQSDQPTITIGGSKYWQVGMTNAGADSVYVTYSPPVSPTPSPSISVSSSVPVTPSVTPSISVSASVGSTPTPTPTPTMSVTPTNSASSICCVVGDFEFNLVCEVTPSPTQSATPTPTPTQTPTPSITASPTPSVTSSITPSPSISQSPSPSVSVSMSPSPSISMSPSPSPSESPTEPPTEAP